MKTKKILIKESLSIFTDFLLQYKNNVEAVEINACRESLNKLYNQLRIKKPLEE